MIICKNKDDYEILKFRSHGWSRDKKIANKYPNLVPQIYIYKFGFNLRPTDIQAAIGISQFKILERFKKVRIKNRNEIIKSLKSNPKWNNQFIHRSSG